MTGSPDRDDALGREIRNGHMVTCNVLVQSVMSTVISDASVCVPIAVLTVATDKVRPNSCTRLNGTERNVDPWAPLNGKLKNVGPCCLLLYCTVNS